MSIRCIFLRCLEFAATGFLRAVCFFLSMAAFGVGSSAAGEVPTVRIVVSSDNAYARETAARLQALIEQSASGAVIDKLDAAAFSSQSLPLAKLTVTVGDVAWNAFNTSSVRDTPLLALMPLRASYERGSRNSTAIYLDQPVARMLNLANILKPGGTRVAVLLGPSTTTLLPTLLAAANERKQRLRLEAVSEEIEVGKVLARAIRDADVLLAIPDPVVHSANTVQPVLLMTYQAGIPVIGYSAAYLRAGAMVALYATPEQLAQQAVEAILAYRDGKGLPPPQEAKYFTIGINSTVARSLGINLPATDVLEQKLRSMKE